LYFSPQVLLVHLIQGPLGVQVVHLFLFLFAVRGLLPCHELWQPDKLGASRKRVIFA